MRPILAALQQSRYLETREKEAIGAFLDDLHLIQGKIRAERNDRKLPEAVHLSIGRLVEFLAAIEGRFRNLPLEHADDLDREG